MVWNYLLPTCVGIVKSPSLFAFVVAVDTFILESVYLLADCSHHAHYRLAQKCSSSDDTLFGQ